MKLKLFLIAAVGVMAAVGTVHADNIRKEWEFTPPSQHFPTFFSSNLKYDVLLNDFFARQWFATPGPGAYSGNPQTIWREWDALACVWFDTTRLKFIGRDANTELKDSLLKVQLDPDGYVYTFPPLSTARNKLGWQSPDYRKSGGLLKSWDWDDSTLGQAGWKLTGGGTTTTGDESCWKLVLTEPDANIQVDKQTIPAYQSPYVVIAMSVSRPGTAAIEWTTDKSLEWSDANKVEFTLGPTNAMATYYLPMYKCQGWRGKITGIRIRPLVDVPDDITDVVLDRVQCAYDTRQPMNNASFILANWRYYLWTGDDDFIKQNIGRIRAAAHYIRKELGVEQDNVATISYWGHDGTSGLAADKARPGYGIGSDWCDILPMGYRNTSLNAYSVAALRAMADIEKLALKAGAKENLYGETGDSFLKLSQSAAKTAGDLLWDAKTGRFIGCVDAKGQKHDYGFVYSNLEALYYGLGDSEKGKSIYSWLDGTRTVQGDTSTGKDIYHWRFAPRATTKRNTDWYVWTWNKPQSVAWGNQVQDGGTSAHLSFYDIMNRIAYKDPDDAYTRFKEVLDWYSEVGDQSGYRSYYAKPGRGTLQGAGTSGGLAINAEATQTTLVPLAFLYGFLGIKPTTEGLLIEPKLPKELTYAGVQGLSYHSVELTISANSEKITVKCTKNPANKSFLLAGRRVVGTFERTVEGTFATLKPAD